MSAVAAPVATTAAGAVVLGATVMRAIAGAVPDGPWLVRADLRDQRGTFLLEDPRYPATATACAVTVQAYPHQLTVLEGRA